MGAPRYCNATSLLITADGGGSNGYRLRLRKLELQRLADELAIPISVCHLPRGTSKWKRARAPHVLVHHAELVRTSAAQGSNRRQLDIQYDDAHRSEDQVRARHPKLRGSHQYLERGFCGHQPEA